MPVDDSINVGLNDAEVDLDDLDKKATKALEALKKERKALQQAQKQQEIGGGIYGIASVPIGGKAPLDLQSLSRQDKKIKKNMKKLIEKMRKKDVKNFGKKKGLLSNIFGDVGAKNIFEMGKNPKSFFMGVAKTIPFLGGVLAAKEIADFIVDEISKIDRFFKKFIDLVDDRVDRFRTLQEQANTNAGLTQRIVTTASGSTEPRYSYNTFEEFNNNSIELENKFQMTNSSGAP